MSNLHQTDTGQWSARLGAVRYLDDGSEEVLLAPRKDVAATYDPSSNTVTSYDYDSFGAEAGAPLSSSYDLKDNPHRYAGAYRDPLWGGYYLKARWYDPDLAIFLSRDPLAGFHPYSYADGSPAMNVDPTGTSAQTSGHVTGEKKVGSILFNVFVAPLVSMFTKEYWSDVAHNKDQAATFLAAGIAAELLFAGLDYVAVSAAWRGLRTGTRWATQDLADLGLNVGQAAVAATHGGKFHATDFAQNLEGFPVGMFYARGLAGIGRRTHSLRATDVAKRIEQLNDDTILIFRARRGGVSSPLAEAAGVGAYNDKLVALSKRYIGENFSERAEYHNTGIDYLRHERRSFSHLMGDAKLQFFASGEKYQLVGAVDLKSVQQLDYANQETFFKEFAAAPWHDGIEVNERGLLEEQFVSRYHSLFNNTHKSVSTVVSYLRGHPYRMNATH